MEIQTQWRETLTGGRTIFLPSMLGIMGCIGRGTAQARSLHVMAPRSGHSVNLDAHKKSECSNVRHSSQLPQLGEWESRLEIRVAWSTAGLSQVPVQIT